MLAVSLVTDILGNLVSVIEPDPQYNPAAPNPPPAYPVSSAPLHTLLTSYTYDQLNHLTQVSMPRSSGTQTRTFAYDPTTQHLTSATNPENGTVSYTYNADGTLATKKDAENNTLSYTYDSYGRLTSSPVGTFTWDTCPANDTYCTNAPGQMVETVFGSNVGPNFLTFQYDYTYAPAGKVLTKMLTVTSTSGKYLNPTDPQASGSLTASYSYDNQGALANVTYPFCQWFETCTPPTFTYAPDAMERPTSLIDNLNHTYVSGVTYNAANQTSYGGRISWQARGLARRAVISQLS